MDSHFIFFPGVWTGEGVITFSMAEDILPCKMIWSVPPPEGSDIHFSQEIDVESFENKMTNHFVLSNVTSSTFQIALSNPLIGTVYGSGLYDKERVAWEFRKADQPFEGFEIYEKTPEGNYTVRAEFTAGQGLRTFVRGTIQKIA